jgi:hypothetical protein
MIVVRDVFDVHPDRITEAKLLIGGLQTTGAQIGLGPARVLLDLTDSYYERQQQESRIVVEREFADVDTFSAKTRAAMADSRWLAAWSACKPVVRQARREILHTI